MTQIHKSKFIILSLCLARLFAPIQLLAVSPILHNANVIYMTKYLCFFKVVTWNDLPVCVVYVTVVA